MTTTQEGQLVLLLSEEGRHHLVRLQSGQAFHTDQGLLRHEALIGLPFGQEVLTHIGRRFAVLEPATLDLLMGVKRATQIVYPKDAGYILLRLDVHPGVRVLEVGTGSGALTLALARMVGQEGRVYSYETRQDLQDLARRNLERVGLEQRVTLRLGDAVSGFQEEGLDAVFVDLREPWRYLEQLRTAVRPGAPFGSLLPTTNQVSRLVGALQESRFLDLEACEVILRQYKPVAERLRPMDRWTAHTGYLVFARTPPIPAAVR